MALEAVVAACSGGRSPEKLRGRRREEEKG